MIIIQHNDIPVVKFVFMIFLFGDKVSHYLNLNLWYLVFLSFSYKKVLDDLVEKIN